MIKIGSDFSGVGAFPQALIRLGIEYDEVFACDMDRYARQTYCLNFGTEHDLKLASQSTIIQRTLLDEFSFDFPLDVYERKIPEESLDIYCTSPPCQAFSMAGKRMGKDDQRGILFFNSLEFIKENKPRYFIFENVKGLLSHDKQDKNAVYGRTFQEWINYLGGKSVNGVHTFFPYEDSVQYHIYFQVLNAKHYGIPQNRERVFIIGIRDDKDNDFQFPKPIPLEKRLKDVLESEVDEKYFLSDKMVNYLKNTPRSLPFTKPNEKDIANCVLANQHKMSTDQEFFSVGTWRTHEDGKGFRGMEDNLCPTIPARAREDGSGQPVVKIGAFRGRNPENSSDRTTGANLKQTLEINESGTSNALTSVQKDNVVVYDLTNDFGEESPREYTEFSPALRSSRSGLATKQLSKQQIDKLQNLEVDENIAGCITEAIGRAGSSDEYISSVKRNAMITQRIRRLTPLECFRLMDFNEDMVEKTIGSGLISDSQCYKQAGNSICVGVLAAIISKLKF